MRIDRLRDLMERGGWSQASLARALRVSPASIQQVLNGSTKRSRVLPEIAAILNVSVEYLLGTTDDIHNLIVLAEARDGDRSLVPVRYFKPIIMKNPTLLKAEMSTVFFTASWLREIIGDTDFDDIIMQEFMTNEMSPTISAGDTVIIIKRQEFDGDPTGIWSISYNDKPLHRRLQDADGDRLRLSADNPSYPDIIVASDQVTLSGRIVWQGRKWGA